MALSWVIDIYHLNHKVWDLLEMIHLNIKVRLNNKDLCIFLKWFYSRWKTQLKLSRFPSTSYLDETLSELICWPRDCWALLLTVHRVLQHEIRDVLTALYSLLYILYSVFCILYFHVNSDCLVSPVFPPSMWWWPTSRPRRYISHLCYMSHSP